MTSGRQQRTGERDEFVHVWFWDNRPGSRGERSVFGETEKATVVKWSSHLLSKGRGRLEQLTPRLSPLGSGVSKGTKAVRIHSPSGFQQEEGGL